MLQNCKNFSNSVSRYSLGVILTPPVFFSMQAQQESYKFRKLEPTSHSSGEKPTR